MSKNSPPSIHQIVNNHQDHFESPDYYQLDDLLSEEHLMIRSSIRDFVKKEITPFIEDWAQKNYFPKEIVSKFGMIGAFDAIKAANDISPAVVAGGISQALLTTAFGLVVAMIIQTLQNVFVSKIDSLVLDMEEQSVNLVDHLHELETKK